MSGSESDEGDLEFDWEGDEGEDEGEEFEGDDEDVAMLFSMMGSMMGAAGGSPAGNGGDPAAGGLNLGMLSGFMQQDGPTIQAVVLKADGSAQELEVDMSPRKNEIGQILGGSSTFLGQLETENVVVMMRRDTDGLEENRTQLPAPLDRAEVVLGDLLLLRMDEGAQPRSFTLQEYREYCAKNPARE